MRDVRDCYKTAKDGRKIEWKSRVNERKKKEASNGISTSTRGQFVSGLEGLDCCEVGVDVGGEKLTTLIGVAGRLRTVFCLGQATVITSPSGSGDQQLSDNQQPITTVTSPISRASIM